VTLNECSTTAEPAKADFPSEPTTLINVRENTTSDLHESPMLIWALTRKSLDGRGESEGTTVKIEIEELKGGVFLLMRYESLNAPFSTSDHLYLSIDKAYE
jgi:hypothetical protein